jgi:ABC-type ATPase with predicted acetyltransferase domain
MEITLTPPAARPPTGPRERAVAAKFHLEAPPAPAPRTIEVPLRPGTVVLVTGPSGGGKTSLLRALSAALARDGIAAAWLDGAARPRPGTRSVLEAWRQPLEALLPALCRAGLAEPRLWLQRPHELSAGEYFRLQLARWYGRPAPVLLADEFGSLLDRTAARVVAYQLGRFVHGARREAARRTAVVATAHDDLQSDLRADVVIRLE